MEPDSFMVMGPDSWMLLAGILGAAIGLAQLLGRIVEKLIDARKPANGLLSEADKAFFREQIYLMREGSKDEQLALERIHEGHRVLLRNIELAERDTGKEVMRVNATLGQLQRIPGRDV